MIDVSTVFATGAMNEHDKDSRTLHLNYDKLSQNVIESLENSGYVIVDDFVSPNISEKYIKEIEDLRDNNLLIPNRTYFSSPFEKGKHILAEKPGIFEADLHQDRIRENTLYLKELFLETEAELCRTLQPFLKKIRLVEGNNSRVIKVQFNTGNGACFPSHFDNPGPPSNRCLTCVIYLNSEWSIGDGGELTIYPFLQSAVKIAPHLGRAVIFRSDLILHRVECSFKNRYCLTIWIDGLNINSTDDINLKISSSCLLDENIEDTMSMFRNSPLQRSISRGVYREVYEKSLRECMHGASGYTEMEHLHNAYLDSIENSPSLAKLVNKLRSYINISMIENN